MITELKSLHPFIVPDLPGCPINMVTLTLKRIARDFLAATEIWEHTIEDIDLVEDQAVYPLLTDLFSAPTYEPVVHRILSVTVNDATIPLRQYKLNATTDPVDPAPLVSKYEIEWEEDYVPDEDDADAMDVELVLVPDWNSESITTAIMTRWGEAFIAGTVGSLAGIQKKPWYNSELHVNKSYDYTAAKTSASREKVVKGQNADLQMKIPQW